MAALNLLLAEAIPIASPIPSTTAAVGSIPDLTQPTTIAGYLDRLPLTLAAFALVVVGLGISIALVHFALRGQPPGDSVGFGEWTGRYTDLIRGLQHAAIITIVTIATFLLTGTIANRYHHWELGKGAQFVTTGSPIEQTSPQVKYTIEEPFTYNAQLNGKLVKVQDKRTSTRLLGLNSSRVQVRVSPENSGTDRELRYNTLFLGEYSVVNRIAGANNFILEISPPKGYALLQDFGVELGGQRLIPSDPNSYVFPIQIPLGSTAKFKVSYRAQGSPRWLYNANGQLLSSFSLSVATNVNNIVPASGILPTNTNNQGQTKVFNWAFNDNVSVRDSFGVYTPTIATVQNKGIFPRLLLLTPGIGLWWLFLMYLSVPVRLREIPIIGGILFASILALTYGSRFASVTWPTQQITPQIVWVGLSLFLLVAMWGFGKKWRVSLAIAIATILGVILPVFGLITDYPGIILAATGMATIAWLTIRNGYGVYSLEPKPRQQRKAKSPQPLEMPAMPVATADSPDEGDVSGNSEDIPQLLPPSGNLTGDFADRPIYRPGEALQPPVTSSNS